MEERVSHIWKGVCARKKKSNVEKVSGEKIGKNLVGITLLAEKCQPIKVPECNRSKN